LDESSQAVLTEAENVNHIIVAAEYMPSAAPEYQSGDDEVRKRLLAKLSSLVMGVPMPGLPKTAGLKAAELMRIITALSTHYPFPTITHPTENGKTVSEKIEPVKFQSVEDVRKWRNDLRAISNLNSWLLRAHKAKFDQLVGEFRTGLEFGLPSAPEIPEEVMRNLQPAARRDIEESTKMADPMEKNSGRILVAGFSRMLNQADNISSAMGIKLDQYQVMKRHVPSKTWFYITIGFASLAFICAVILPMFCSVLPVFVWKVVPVLFYAYSLFCIIKWTAKL
jgi:hypothetical protein